MEAGDFYVVSYWGRRHFVCDDGAEPSEKTIEFVDPSYDVIRYLEVAQKVVKARL